MKANIKDERKRSWVWVISYKDYNRKPTFYGYGADVFYYDSEKEATQRAELEKKKLLPDFKAYVIKKVEKLGENFGGSLGSWQFNESGQLEFYRSTWQGD